MRIVLLIDDDEDDREIFGEALNALNGSIKFEQAVNGLDALEKLSKPGFETPDVIFLDLNMPKMDGREFLVEIKKKDGLKEIPVIIYSTSSNSGDIQFSVANRANNFMTKHHSIVNLKAELKTVLQNLA